MRPGRLLAMVAVSVTVALALAPPAFAAGWHVPLVQADFLGVGHLAGSVLGALGGAVLGGLNWTVSVAAKFLLATLGGLVKLLIPASWARDALGVMHWIVAVPDYAGTITSPSGAHSYGFSGINALRDLFTWLGAALLPLTLTFATSRAMLGSGGHPGAPLVRVIALAAVLISYPWWWSQAAAIVNQVTSFIFALGPVSVGVRRLMGIAVGGQIIAGWAFGGVIVMGAVGFALLAIIFLKVAIILIGAVLYALGPLMLALVPTESGLQLARGWASAALALLALPLLWACTFAVGALLINDTNRAGVLVGGSGTIAHLFGGLLVGLAGLASLWLCLKIARELGGMLRTQFGGLLALAHARGASPAATPAVGRDGAQSLRSFTQRVGQAGGAAVGALSGAGPIGAAAGRLAGGAATFARGGLAGVTASGIRAGATAGAPAAAAIIGRSRAGAVAVQMGRAARGSWQHTTPARNPQPPRADRRAGVNASNPQPARQSATSGTRQRAHSTPAQPSPHAPAGTTSAGQTAPDSGERTAQRSTSTDTRPPNAAPSPGSSTPPPNAPPTARSSTPPPAPPRARSSTPPSARPPARSSTRPSNPARPSRPSRPTKPPER